MAHEAFLSRQARGLRESAIRKMGALLGQVEGVVSFAPGYPSEDLFDWDALRAIAADLLSGRDGKVLQYGATRGYRPLIEQIVGLMAERGVRSSAEQVIVTTGSQQALDLLARVLIDPGDVLLVELPSYVGAISAFQNLGATLVGVPQRPDGIDLDALRATTARLRAEGRVVKAFYTVPNFQNPTGRLVSLAKRAALVDWAVADDVLIIEDDPYGALYFEDVTTAAETRPIAADDRDGRVIYLSSFSKTLAPGLRTAWLSAPAAITARIDIAKQSADLCSSPFDQRMVAAAISQGVLARGLPRMRATYQAKRDVMVAALQSALGHELTWEAPRGGFFLWTQLPAGVSSEALMPIALRLGVLYVTGEAFYVDGRGADHIRLAFSAPTPARIEEGVRRLARAISETRVSAPSPAPLAAARS